MYIIYCRALDLEFSPQKQAESRVVLASPEEHQVLLQRLAQLEVNERSRQTREIIFYPIVTVYMLYKFVNWVMGR